MTRVEVKPYLREGRPVAGYLRDALDEGFDPGVWFHVAPVERANKIRTEGLLTPSQGAAVATAPHREEGAVYLWPTRRDATQWINFMRSNHRHRAAGIRDYRVYKVQGVEPRKLAADPELMDYVLRYFLYQKHDPQFRPMSQQEQHLADALDQVGFYEEGHVGGPIHLTLRDWLAQQPDQDKWIWLPATGSEQPPSWFSPERPYQSSLDVLQRMPVMLRTDLARWVSLNEDKMNAVMHYGSIPAANVTDVSGVMPKFSNGEPVTVRVGDEQHWGTIIASWFRQNVGWQYNVNFGGSDGGGIVVPEKDLSLART